MAFSAPRGPAGTGMPADPEDLQNMTDAIAGYREANGLDVADTGFQIALCVHPAGQGCWRCCSKCNYDRHECPGCGTPLKHGESCCPECANL